MSENKHKQNNARTEVLHLFDPVGAFLNTDTRAMGVTTKRHLGSSSAGDKRGKF